MSKILVVDDEDLIRIMVTELLSQDKHEVIHALDGDDAIKKAQLEKPDLIVLDMNMPKKTGWDAAPILRAHPDTKSTPIIALTADATTEALELAHDAGCDLYLTKKTAPQKLRDAVQKLLNAPAT